MTTHPTDLDTLLKKESPEREWTTIASDMLARHFDAWTTGVDRLAIIAEFAEVMRASNAVHQQLAETEDELRAAEAKALTARRDALEEAARYLEAVASVCSIHIVAEAHRNAASGLRTLASTVPGGEETGWRPMESAPKNGAKVALITRRRSVLAAKFDNSFSVDDTGCVCGTWVAANEGEHPRSWTDGACWDSNEDGESSDPPVGWMPLPPPPHEMKEDLG